jgi:hypothetical protein
MPLIDDLEAFRDLFYRKRTPRNGSQEALLRAWDAIELVHSDGFESLIEQSVPLDEYAAALAEVGMATAAPIVKRVQELLAGAPHDDDSEAYWTFVHDHFDSLKRLAEDFWAQSVNSDQLLLQYVNDHRPEFAEYLSGPAAGA